MGVEFRILGPLEALADGHPLPIEGAKQRALLALLVVHANETMRSDRLIDEVWGDAPPATAHNTLQVHLSRLRRALTTADGRSPLVRDAGGYRLQIEPGSLDLDRFTALAEEARVALASGDPVEARARFIEALSLWRGRALGDLAEESFAAPIARDLEELRLAAMKDRVEAELALGEHSAVLHELQALVREHPLDERLCAQLMLALYRSGRQAEALEVFRSTQRALAELGLEASEDLRRLHRAVLNHDPALQTEARPAGRRRDPRRPRRSWMTVGAIALPAAVAVFVVGAGLRGEAPVSVPPNAVALVDTATNDVSGVISVGSAPGAVALDAARLWVATHEEQLVSRVDLKRRAVERTYSVVGFPDALAVGRGHVWVASASGSSLTRIRPQDGTTESRRLPSGLLRGAPCAVGGPLNRRLDTTFIGSLVLLRDHAWFVCLANALARIDLASGRPTTLPYVQSGPVAIAQHRRSLWVANVDEQTVAEVDDPTGEVIRTIAVPGGPRGIVSARGALWVTACEHDSVVRIEFDSSTSDTLRFHSIEVGDVPTHIVRGARALWVLNRGDGTVSRIDPATARVVSTIEIGGTPAGIAVGSRLVAVSVREADPWVGCVSP